MFYFFVSPSHQQAVNPCVALKLPLCRVKQEFAEEHGIRTEKPKSTPTRSRLVVQPEENPSKPIQRINTPNSFTREGKYYVNFIKRHNFYNGRSWLRDINTDKIRKILNK